MAPTSEELMQLAVAAIKAETDDIDGIAAALARRVGIPYQRVYRWVTGNNGPDADAALTILDAFGWLNIPEDARERAELPPDPRAVQLEMQLGVAALLEHFDIPKPVVQPASERERPKQRRPRR